MTAFATLQQRHEALLARQDALAADDIRQRAPAAEGLIQDARQFVADAVAQSDQVADPRERDLLRAYLRYWATFIYDWSGVFPKTDLRPAALSGSGSNTDHGVEPVDPNPRKFPWGWLALAAVLLIAVVAAGFSLSRFEDTNGSQQPTPAEEGSPTPTSEISPNLPGGNLPIDDLNATQVQSLVAIKAHEGAAMAVAFNPRNTEIATSGADSFVRIWDLHEEGLVHEMQVGNSPVRTVDYAPSIPRSADPHFLLAGGNDRSIRIFDSTTFLQFAEFAPTSGESGFVFSARFSPDGRLFASGHGDGVARLWDIARGTENSATQQGFIGSRLEQFDTGATTVFDVAYRDNGNWIALAQGGTQTGVQVVDSSLQRTLCDVDEGPARAVAFSPGRDMLAAGMEDGRLQLIEVTPNGCRAYYGEPAHEGGVTDVAFSPTGEWLVTGGRDGTLKIWTPDGQWLATLTSDEPVEAVAVAPDAVYIASVHDRGSLKIWGIP